MPNQPLEARCLTETEALRLLGAVRLGGGNRFLKRGVGKELTRRTVSLLVRMWMDSCLLLSRFRLDDPGNVLARHTDGLIGACWHHRLLGMLLAYREVYGRGWANWRTFAMISASEDGELIARIFRDYGGSCVRGSASRGATDALRAAITELNQGGQVFLTPDGPRGPSKSVKDGAIELARITGKPIVPLSANFGACLRFERSWDRFELPLPNPLGQVSLHVGEPIWVLPDADVNAVRVQLLAAMHEVTGRAEKARRLRTVKLGRPREKKS